MKPPGLLGPVRPLSGRWDLLGTGWPAPTYAATSQGRPEWVTSPTKASGSVPSSVPKPRGLAVGNGSVAGAFTPYRPLVSRGQR